MKRKQASIAEMGKYPLLKEKTIYGFAFILLFFSLFAHAQNSAQADSNLINSFIKSKGYTYPIVFDDSNIKQFWIDKSVVSQNGFITIFNSTGNLSDLSPLKIQLANVNEAQDCKIEMITESSNVVFSIYNTQNRKLSSSVQDDDFINYHVFSSSFHLEDTPDTVFFVKFSAPLSEIRIKKIILSFEENKNGSYLAYPGTFLFNKDNLINRDNSGAKSEVKWISDNSFEITGVKSVAVSSKRLLTSDHAFDLSLKVKNAGEEPATVYIGYEVHSKNGEILRSSNYPYKDINKVLTVVSSAAENSKIIVDAYPEWGKGCFLAINAKEDMTDIPSFTFADGVIKEIKQLENGQAEITLSKPLAKALGKGTKVRVHGVSGGYLYTHQAKLELGQEETFSSSIAKDNSFLQYSPKAFSRGAYYVVPLILSYSSNPDKQNTILISNYKISY